MSKSWSEIVAPATDNPLAPSPWTDIIPPAEPTTPLELAQAAMHEVELPTVEDAFEWSTGDLARETIAYQARERERRLAREAALREAMGIGRDGSILRR